LASFCLCGVARTSALTNQWTGSTMSYASALNSIESLSSWMFRKKERFGSKEHVAAVEEVLLGVIPEQGVSSWQKDMSLLHLLAAILAGLLPLLSASKIVGRALRVRPQSFVAQSCDEAPFRQFRDMALPPPTCTPVSRCSISCILKEPLVILPRSIRVAHGGLHPSLGFTQYTKLFP
jgi:hypothetical protein